MNPYISKCRLCGATELHELLDLGVQYFTGLFPKKQDQIVPSGPLTLIKCAECDLVQLAHSFDLNQLYGQTYGYRSGLNQSMVQHLRSKVESLVQKYRPEAGDLIIDIGSNDSTLLQCYPDRNLKLVGVDPSGPKFKRFYPEHIQLIPDFFSAGRVVKELGQVKAKLITSIAMFYDLEEPQKFVDEIASLLANDGVWTFEQSYLPAMLDQVSYDTVCHEHLEYYALKQIHWMTEKAGLKIIDLEFNDVNGGSFSISVAKKQSAYPEITERIQTILAAEAKRGLHTLTPYVEFAKTTEHRRRDLLAFLDSLKAQGKTVLGYGASTKGNVLLQYCGLTPQDIPAIAEVNEDKFGSFTPGTHIPIISESEARAMNPDYFLVLPWHFKTGILAREKDFLRQGGQFIFPLPKIEVVSFEGSHFPDTDSLKGFWRRSTESSTARTNQ